MSATPESTLANTDQRIADLERQLAECKAERDEYKAERDEYKAERDEALEQQTATAEVLQVINSSPGDLTPVFNAILEKAHNLCGVEYGALQLYDGEKFCAVATRGYPEKLEELLRHPYSLEPTSPVRALLHWEPLVEIPDVIAHQAEAPNPRAEAAIAVGIRSALFLPLRRDNLLLGTITAGRKEARPFLGKEIALLQNFAAQAVIAMENARLLTETREALEQQTATAEVLQVINSSPGDLTPVFDAMLEKALRLCDAGFGFMAALHGELVHVVAERGIPANLSEYHRDPYPVVPGTPMHRFLYGAEVIHIADAVNDADTWSGASPRRRPYVELGGARSVLAVPLRKDGFLLGCFVIYRRHTQAFSDKQIALLQNFAAQAVIAMENARLLTETREALAQQTATAEVLQVINSSPGDLTPVFDAMLEKAIRLCDGVQGSLWTFNGDRRRLAVARGISAEYVEVLREQWERREPSEQHPMSRLMRGERVVQILDMSASDLYRTGDPAAVAGVEHERGRTLMFVALVKDNAPVGAFIIARRKVQAFSDKQIALVQNFAARMRG